MASTLFALFILIAVFVYLAWTDRRRMRLQRLRMKKMLSSPLFAQLQPVLKRSRKQPLESLTIDESGIRFRFVYPLGYEYYYNFHTHGFKNLSVEKIEALLLLFEEVMPMFGDRDHYKLHRKCVRHYDGTAETSYRYVIRNDFKTVIVRAPYYNGALQPIEAW